MILTAYIILGHKDWRNGEIKIFTITSEDKIQSHKEELENIIQEGRIPISMNNIEILINSNEVKDKDLICEKSELADLTVIGFRAKVLKHTGAELFQQYDRLGNVLFVNSTNEIEIV